MASVLRGVEVRRLISSVAAGHPAFAGAASEPCRALEWTDGALQWRAVHPLDSDYQRSLSTNAMSCVVRERLGGTVVLLTGDLPAREEQALVGGARGGLERALADGAASRQPLIVDSGVACSGASGSALLQAGYRNRFGHPHAEVLARYAEQGIPVMRTDHAEAAQWRFAANDAIDFRSWRSFAVRYGHNRPGAGQVQPKSEADETAEEPPGQPFFGMP